MPLTFDLGIELEPISIAAARALGMQDDTAQAFEAHDPKNRTVLAISRRQGNCAAGRALKDGDIIYRLQGCLVNSFREVELAVAGQKEVDIEVVRYGEVTQRKLDPCPHLDLLRRLSK